MKVCKDDVFKSSMGYDTTREAVDRFHHEPSARLLDAPRVEARSSGEQPFCVVRHRRGPYQTRRNHQGSHEAPSLRSASDIHAVSDYQLRHSTSGSMSHSLRASNQASGVERVGSASRLILILAPSMPETYSARRPLVLMTRADGACRDGQPSYELERQPCEDPKTAYRRQHFAVHGSTHLARGLYMADYFCYTDYDRRYRQGA